MNSNLMSLPIESEKSHTAQMLCNQYNDQIGNRSEIDRIKLDKSERDRRFRKLNQKNSQISYKSVDKTCREV